MSVQGPSSRRAAVLLGRGEARRVHRRQLHALGRERLARGAEVEQQRRAVVAQEDVGRLDVEVQQLVACAPRAGRSGAARRSCASRSRPSSAAVRAGCAAAACGRARSASPCTRSRWRGRSSARAPRSDARSARARGLPRRSTSCRSGSLPQVGLGDAYLRRHRRVVACAAPATTAGIP